MSRARECEDPGNRTRKKYWKEDEDESRDTRARTGRTMVEFMEFW